MRRANFRDVATNVKAIRANRLFRSAQVFDLSHEPHAVIDLRRDADKRHDGDASSLQATTPQTCRRVNLPMVSRDAGVRLLLNLPGPILFSFITSGGREEIIGDYYMGSADTAILMYSTIIHFAQAQFQQIMLILADEQSYPVHVHCVAGKDRTGIVVGLVARLCGADVGEIACDYAESFGNLARDRDSGLFPKEVEPLLKDSLIKADWETMVGLLRTVDTRYGGVRQFLNSHCGIDDQVLDAVVRNLAR